MTRSKNNLRFGWMLVFASLALMTVPALGQIGGRDIVDSNLTDAELRDSTLLWLDTFLTESNLLEKNDIAKIRDAVSKMSDTQLQQWLAQTKQLRQYVEGEKWQNTKKWLREFMRVQAIYGEQELQTIREEIVNADADQMMGILKRIQAKHDSLVWMHQAAERNRQVEIGERDAYLASRVASSQASRGGAPRELPLFGTGLGGGTGEKPSKGYYTYGPMIDNRTMARAAVWTELWGPGFIIGF